jgi:holo-[acyl-carrier protein] synthase
MLDAARLTAELQPALNAPVAGVRVGIDVASVADIGESLAAFGERFAERFFTPQELADARAVQGEGAEAERLAARFAAKEAVIKALDLPEAGIGWRDIELTRDPGGRPALQLHGRTAELARALGVRDWAVSISHDGPQACAVVVGLLAREDSSESTFPSH